MDTNKLENRDKGQTMISDQSHRLLRISVSACLDPFLFRGLSFLEKRRIFYQLCNLRLTTGFLITVSRRARRLVSRFLSPVQIRNRYTIERDRKKKNQRLSQELLSSTERETLLSSNSLSQISSNIMVNFVCK